MFPLMIIAKNFLSFSWAKFPLGVDVYKVILIWPYASRLLVIITCSMPPTHQSFDDIITTYHRVVTFKSNEKGEAKKKRAHDRTFV